MAEKEILTYRTVKVRGSPLFAGRLNWPSARLRAYIHLAGLGIYGPNKNALYCINKAAQHLENTFQNPSPEVAELLAKDKADYFLAAVWNNGSPVIDFFRFGGIREWPGNPEMRQIVVRERKVIQDYGATCEDGLIMLGAEAQYRRKTSGLTEYLKYPPIIGGIDILVFLNKK